MEGVKQIMIREEFEKLGFHFLEFNGLILIGNLNAMYEKYGSGYCLDAVQYCDELNESR